MPTLATNKHQRFVAGAIQHDGLMRITGKPDSNSEEEEAEERPECQLMQKKKRTSKGRAQTQDDQIEGDAWSSSPM